jgi:hypothetical protein
MEVQQHTTTTVKPDMTENSNYEDGDQTHHIEEWIDALPSDYKKIASAQREFPQIISLSGPARFKVS